MIKISLLHISRQRPQLAYDCFREWSANCNKKYQVEYILAVDADDPTLPAYMKLFSETDKSNIGLFVMNVTDSHNGVQAINNAAKVISMTSEIIMSVSDDQGCFPGWDQAIEKVLEGVDNFTQPKFIGVSDGLQAYGSIFVYYIANRAYYKKFGWIIYPEYDGMFGDNDMMELARRTGALIDAPYLLFQHRHYSIGLGTFDEVYAKTNNPNDFHKNQMIFEARKKRNFDL